MTRLDLFEFAPCGYAVTQSDGHILEGNRLFREWTGWSSSLQQRFTDLLPRGARIFFELHYEPLLAMQGFLNEVAVDLICAEDRRLPVLMNVVRQPGDGRNLIILFPASGRRRYEQDLLDAEKRAREAEAAKGEFLANMSHEIRTPMNGVLGFAGLLESTPLNPEQAESVSMIRHSAEALLSILNDILDYSKLEAGKLSFENLRFDLRLLIEEVCRLFTPRLKDSDLTLSLDWQAGNNTELVSDPTRVRQILLNLIGNAVKFTEHGQITVRVLRTNSFRVEVSDTGIGIPLERQGSIFQKFVQADHSTTRRYGGTGLGLAISRQLVEAMGGSIGFESLPQAGSTFWFELPVGLLSSHTEATHGPEPEATLPPGLNILLAEDNPVNEKLARRLLENLGCVVDVARHGVEAIRKVADQDYDLVLMDCQMPKLDGFEATIAILRIKPGTRVIALTANAMKGDRERCVAAGMVDYLTKPVSLASLRQTLARNVRARSPQGPPLSLPPAS